MEDIFQTSKRIPTRIHLGKEFYNASVKRLLEKYNVELFSVKSPVKAAMVESCLLYTSPSPRDLSTSRMPSSA